MPDLTTLKVSQIEESRVVKVRDQLNKLAVQDYSDLYASSGGDALPALDIFQEKNCKRWIVADGRHRLAAAKKAGLKELPCKVREGDEVAALDFAIGANIKHGVRRSDTDVGLILRSVFNTPELADKYRTDGDLSDKVGVSTKTVQRHRARWRDEDGGNRKAKVNDTRRAAKHARKPSLASAESETKKGPELDRVSSSPEQPQKSRITAADAPPKKPPAGTKSQPLSHGELHDLKHGLGLVMNSGSKLDLERVASEGKISWSVVEGAHDILTKLLEHR